MIKKYVMIIAMLLTILIFTSTSTASFLFSKGKVYELLPENSPLKIMSNDADDEDDDLVDPEGPEEDVPLPKIWNMVGEITPDDGNEPVDDLEETTTIDADGEVGATQDEWVVDSDGGEGAASNGITIDEGEWTVDHDGEGGTLERFVNGISSPGSGGSAENNKVDVVVLTDGDH